MGGFTALKEVDIDGSPGTFLIAAITPGCHASGTDYQYDAAGNMTYDATASLSYTFDQETASAAQAATPTPTTATETVLTSRIALLEHCIGT
jgi:hypothetical protein